MRALDMLEGPPEAIEHLRRYIDKAFNQWAQMQTELARIKANEKLPEVERVTLEVSDFSKSGGQGRYTRSQPRVVMRWVCAVCGAAHEREQLPGNTPKYCLPGPGEERSACQKEAHRQRQRAYKERKKAQAE